MKPFGEFLRDARISEMLHLGLLGVVFGDAVDEICPVCLGDHIALDDGAVVRKPVDDLCVRFSIGLEALHRLESGDGLGDVLAVIAVDHPGRCAGAIQKNLEANDRRLPARRRIARLFGRNGGERSIVDGFRLKLLSAGGAI